MEPTVQVKKVKRFKIGYEVRTEIHKWDGCNIEIESAYTDDGKYIGDTKTAYRLYNKWGIKPEISQPDHKVCSIGYSRKDNKWYGWSHRAMYGFQIGDTVKEGDCTNSSGLIESYLKEHPEKDLSLPVGFRAETRQDCRRMAVAFAESVS